VPDHALPDIKVLSFPQAVVNAFLVEADVLTLIDTGTPGGAGKVLAAIRGAGHGERDLKRILLTHRHSDHAANAAELARITGASVHCSPADAPYIREGTEQPRPRPATLLGRVMVPYVKAALPWSVPSVPAHDDLVGDTTIGAFRVIDTPGHTAGHVSLLWPDRGVLFTGDAAAHITSLGPHPAADDPVTARTSFATLSRLDFDAAYFGHGRPLIGATTQFRSAAARRIAGG
jgi:glyoxylase-like metal-dependent hydrolase (beta-lactamase superfamily II)